MNNKGNILSSALIVIAILTFSLTSVAALTINLSSNTHQINIQTSEESVAKGLIKEAADQFEVYIRDGGTFVDFDNAGSLVIEQSLGVSIDNITPSYPEFGDHTNGAVTYVYNFSYLLTNGKTIYLEVYVSSYGESLDSPEVFEYNIATDGSLIMNGGTYIDSNIFGNKTYITDLPFFYDELYNQYRALNSSFPHFTTAGSETYVFANEYKYCTALCWSATGNTINDDIIIKNQTLGTFTDTWDNYTGDKGLKGDLEINDFFTSFDYDSYFFDYIKNESSTNSRDLTQSSSWEELTWDNVDSVIWGATDNYYYDNVTNANYWQNRTFRDSSVYNGNLTIRRNLSIQNSSDALVVLGDLTIDTTRSSINLNGNFVVLGNLTFVGNTVDIDGTFFVKGETIVNMNENHGISTSGNNTGFTLLSKDNIRIEKNHYYEYLASAYGDYSLDAFMFTEQSIYINAVKSLMDYHGALYALAKGGSINPINVIDESSNQVNGIIINNFQGYLTDIGWVYWSNSSNSYTNNRFKISPITQGSYITRFDFIPDFESIIVSEGVWTFFASEFNYN